MSQLSSGDIVISELYHKNTIKNCYVQFCNEYKRASKTLDEDEGNNKWLKALALNKIIVIETGRSNNVKSFKVKDLEEIYMSLLWRTM